MKRLMLVQHFTLFHWLISTVLILYWWLRLRHLPYPIFTSFEKPAFFRCCPSVLPHVIFISCFFFVSTLFVPLPSLVLFLFVIVILRIFRFFLRFLVFIQQTSVSVILIHRNGRWCVPRQSAVKSSFSPVEYLPHKNPDKPETVGEHEHARFRI